MNVITLGDGNVVSAQYATLHKELTNLQKKIAGSQLPEGKKLDLSVDVESIKDQLAKSEPDKTIVGHLWKRVQEVATLGGFADAIQKVLPFISGLVPP